MEGNKNLRFKSVMSNDEDKLKKVTIPLNEMANK